MKHDLSYAVALAGLMGLTIKIASYDRPRMASGQDTEWLLITDGEKSFINPWDPSRPLTERQWTSILQEAKRKFSEKLDTANFHI